ncbi:MAG TPA: FlgD immunoglobulin-like domain containing protein [Candidatus Eisenbacteria bacterium]|nr:FlgD immunoglobulin-like domain containing protein [Candidatus Eisenbacteria bacterium]
MRRSLPLMLGMLLAAATPLLAGTFDRSRIAPDLGLDALTRSVARDQVGRDLFSNPYSAVTLGTVDVYDAFPYVETRTFAIVSDPAWNRLVFGEPGKTLRAFDGAQSALGRLRQPRGLAADEAGRVYVADAGNDRIVVLQARTEFDQITLTPLYEIRGLHAPNGVAYSDGGTPFKPGDDVLYVADSGRNRVASFTLGSQGAQLSATVGELGSGRGRFAGPMAIAVGRSQGASTREVYVADAHTRRIVHLRDQGASLQWIGEVTQDADVVTALSTDQWGNLYASAPQQGVVRKFGPSLTAVAELRSDVSRPRSFHVPFVTVRDHRAGTVTRVGQPSGFSVDQWAGNSGMRQWSLGLDLSQLAMVGGAPPAARFTLTDQANVTLELLDAGGQSILRRTAGVLPAGIHTLPLRDEDLRAASGAGEVMVRISARSSYPDGPSASAYTRLSLGGAAVAPSSTRLLGNSPNPVRPWTRISLVLAAGERGAVTLRIYDAGGRLVRTFANRFSPGLNEVMWNGTDDQGRSLPAGVYLSRLNVGKQEFNHKMVLVR